MGSQHLPSFTFYAILDPLVRPSQSIVGCTDLKVEGTGVCVCVFQTHLFTGVTPYPTVLEAYLSKCELCVYKYKKYIVH